MVKSFKLSNGWIAEQTENGTFLEVYPIPNSIFSRHQKVEIPESLFEVIMSGERDIDVLFKKFNLSKFVIIWEPRKWEKPPQNTEHTYYGAGWFVEEVNGKYFLDYLLSTQGGGSNRIEISNEVYHDARLGLLKLNELLKKHNLQNK
jgi:hypothetical protein